MERRELPNPAVLGTLIGWGQPEAAAEIRGREGNPGLRGKVSFYDTGSGILAVSEFRGLQKPNQQWQVLGLHIHEGDSCTGTAADPFADAGGHYNPGRAEHPFHAGDLPPVFVNGDWGWGAVMTTRFRITDIIGKTVILHGMPDDFHTQPSGNSGEKIGCGLVRRTSFRRGEGGMPFM